MAITDELLYGDSTSKPAVSGNVTDELLYGNKATSGRQVGSGQFAPIEPKPTVISEPSRGASMATAFMGGIPTDKQAAVNYFATQRGI